MTAFGVRNSHLRTSWTLGKEYSMSKFSSLEDPDKNCQRWLDETGDCWLKTHS